MMFLPQQQQTTQATENKLPQWVQDAGRANYDMASNMNPAAFAAYTGQRVAGMNDVQLNAINAANANVGAANPLYANAMRSANNAYGYAIPAFQGAVNSLTGSGPNSVNSAISNINQVANTGYQQIDPSVFGFREVNSNPSAAYGAQQDIRSAMNNSQAPINAAMAGTVGAAAQANNVGNVDAQQVSSQSVPQGDLSRYLSPFSDNVINSSLRVLDQQRLNALNGNADQAINAKAFGGSRQAIQDAATNTNFGLQGAQLAANLQNQNYTQALAALQNDQSRNLQAQQANQGANLQAGLANQQMGYNVANLGLNAANQLGSLGLNNLSGLTSAANTFGNLGLQGNAQNMQAQQANQSAGLQNQNQILNALQSNQNAGLQSQQNALSAYNSAGNLGLGSSNALNNIGQTSGNLGLSNAQLQGALTGQQQSDYLNSINAGTNAGNALQTQRQNELTAQQQQYLEQQNAMLAPLNLRMQALGMTPYNTSTSSTGSSFGFQGQAYQPTSSNPIMGALGGGLAGAQYGPWGAAAGAGLGLLSGIRR
jgi:hypothetical protein